MNSYQGKLQADRKTYRQTMVLEKYKANYIKSFIHGQPPIPRKNLSIYHMNFNYGQMKMQKQF